MHHWRALLRLDRHHPRQPVLSPIDESHQRELFECLPDPYQTRSAARWIHDPFRQRGRAEVLPDLEAHRLLALEPAGLEEGRQIDELTTLQLRADVLAHPRPRLGDVRAEEAHG